MGLWRAVITFFFSILVASDLLGCAVCDPGQSNNRVTFVFTTALLTLAPLTMLGWGAFYIWRKHR